MVGLGTWVNFDEHADPADLVDLVGCALDAGVRLFDTADGYGSGRGEELLGAALRGVARDRFVVGTKVGLPRRPGGTDGGLSRDHVLATVQTSLGRLGVDHLDLLTCHRPDPATPLAETCGTMDELVRAGTVRAWGLSEWPDPLMDSWVDHCHTNALTAPEVTQIEYNALWRRAERGTLAAAQAAGLGVIATSPLAQGVLTGKYRDPAAPPADSRAAGVFRPAMRHLDPATLHAVAELADRAADWEVGLPTVAVAWCLRRGEVSTVLVGARTAAQFREVIDGLDRVDPSLVADLDRSLAPAPRSPARLSVGKLRQALTSSPEDDSARH